MASIDLQSLRALLLALVLMLCLYGCARSAEPGEAALPADAATAQSAASNVAPPQTAADTTWACPPEVDGPVISLRPDTSRKYPEQADVVRIQDGEFAGRSAVIIWRKDLNKDGNLDVGADILGLSGSWGEGLHVIYASCRDDHYIRVWGPRHAFKVDTDSVDVASQKWKKVRQVFRDGSVRVHGFSSVDSTYVRLE